MTGGPPPTPAEILIAAQRSFEVACIALYYAARAARDAGADLPDGVRAALDVADATNTTWLRLARDLS